MFKQNSKKTFPQRWIRFQEIKLSGISCGIIEKNYFRIAKNKSELNQIIS